MDESPTTLFASYEHEFHLIIQSIQDKLEGGGKDQRGEQRKSALRKVEIELDEADDIVDQLEVEIQGIPQSIKTQYTARLKLVKSELTRYKKLAKDTHTQLARGELFSGGGGGTRSDDPYSEHSDRGRLLAGTEILSDGNRRIQSSQRIALEAEDQGADILRNLRAQRETIEGARDTLHTADTHIDRSAGTIKNMIRQMHKQRIIISGIIAFLVALVILILYFKLVR